MQNEKRLEDLKASLEAAWAKLKIDEKLKKLESLETEANDPDLWRNPDHAKSVNENLKALTDETHAWTLLKTQLDDLGELIALGELDLEAEISVQLTACEATLNDLKKALKFTGPYDSKGAILRITAGAGGVEAMDWASMLERMYLRFADRKNWRATNLERTTGEEAGLKTAVYEITGANVYGHLKSEHGTHRLVRLSPFNADHLRQTSFALVEILPLLDDENDLQIADKDLRIDVFHSGGHGGQSVNTTNSAVRITHLPTNIVVTIQNERSQLQNKAKALEILRGKLLKMQLDQKAESLDELRAGESASWGQQIRNYVLQPYQLVKDTRTKHESKDPAKVLDGHLDDFIDAYLDGSIE